MITECPANIQRYLLALTFIVALLASGCGSRDSGAQSSAPSPDDISADTVSELRQSFQWGMGRSKDISYSAEADRFVVATPLGAYLYQSSDLSAVGYIDTEPHIDQITLSPSGALIVVINMPVSGVAVYDTESGRMLHTLADAGYRIDDLVISPDDGYLAYISTVRTTDDEGKTVIERILRLWDAGSGELLMQHSTAPEDGLSSLAFSPNGHWLTALAASESRDSLLRWDLASGEQASDVQLDAGDEIHALAYSPDGGSVVGLADAVSGQAGAIYVWSTDDWVLEQRLEPDTRQRLLDVVAGAHMFATVGDDAAVVFWSRGQSGEAWTQQIMPLPQSEVGPVRTIVFSADGQTFTAATDKSVHLWTAGRGTRLWSSEADSAIESINFSVDNQHLIVVYGNGVVESLSTGAGESLAILADHLDVAVNDIALTVSGQSILAASDGSIYVWDQSNDTTAWATALAGGSSDAIELAPDGTLALAVAKSSGADTWEDPVQIWSWPELQKQNELNAPHSKDREATCSVYRNDVAISPDGSLVASPSYDHTVRIWHTADGSLHSQLAGHELVAVDVAFSPDGRHIASASTDGTVRVWRIEDGKLVHTLPDHFAGAANVIFSPDGELLITSDATGHIHIWQTSNGKKLRTLDEQKNIVSNLAFSPDGTLLVAGGNKGVLQFWDTDSWEHVFTLPAHRGTVNAVRFAERGDVLVTGSEDGTVRMWTR